MRRDDALAGFALTEPAPAKINLALHVTGPRADGYHLLDSARNDLAAPARALCPEIADIETALTATGASLVRMSGSGATCFGLYRDPDEADRAAEALAAQHPGWFIQATTSFSGGTDVTDR